MTSRQPAEEHGMNTPPKCTTCDDAGIAVYPMRLCGDCDAGKACAHCDGQGWVIEGAWQIGEESHVKCRKCNGTGKPTP